MADLTLDQLSGITRLTIDGEERALRFTQRALKSIIDELAVDGIAGIVATLSSLDADTLRVMVWAGLLHEQPDLKADDLLDMFFPAALAWAAVIEGVNLACWGVPQGTQDEPDGEASEDIEGPPPRSGTGAPRSASV
jgi:hypothetical protein